MHLELVILGLLVAIAALAALAGRLRVPYPILLVIGGLCLGWVPDADKVELDPDLVLLIFLPPLLYGAAFFASPREMARNARPIAMQAIGLVFATTLVVAAAAHWAIGLSWSVSFVLGAVVSPTDAVAPAEIVRRLGVPRRLVTIIEGENLTNDWTALTIYKFAVAAVMTGAFSFGEAAWKFVLTGLGGIAIGLVVGVLMRWARRRLDDPATEITISLFTGYAAYLPAEELGLSGVIAAVTTGLYMGWYASELTTPTTRMQLVAVWETVQFLLNAVLFVLVGLQLPGVLDGLDGFDAGELVGYALLVSAAVIVTRIVWTFALSWVVRTLDPRIRASGTKMDWRQTLVGAWCSMRGGVALAAALAIPLATDGGGPFPDRDLLIFLTYAVILATLVGQGLTLAPLIRRLGVEDDGRARHEELGARMYAAAAAAARVEELADEDWTYDDTIDRMRRMYDFRRRRFEELKHGNGDGGIDERSTQYQRLLHEIIAAEREALLELRNSGRITDEVMRRVERDLDLEEARLDL
ncbi:MAG TPA: Na+/H+ antiporter [Solirubrobacteraceae bacterium]